MKTSWLKILPTQNTVKNREGYAVQQVVVDQVEASFQFYSHAELSFLLIAQISSSTWHRFTLEHNCCRARKVVWTLEKRAPGSTRPLSVHLSGVEAINAKESDFFTQETKQKEGYLGENGDSIN